MGGKHADQQLKSEIRNHAIRHVVSVDRFVDRFQARWKYFVLNAIRKNHGPFKEMIICEIIITAAKLLRIRPIICLSR